MTTIHFRPALHVRALPIAALAVAATLLAAGCSDGSAKDKSKEGADAAQAVPVEVQPLKRASMVAVYSGTASIEANDEAEVVAKVGGEVLCTVF